MVFLVQKETEQPKKKLQIKRLKLSLPKGESLLFLSILLCLIDLLSLLFFRTIDSGITGLLIAITILHINHREEMKKNANNEASSPGEVKVIDMPTNV